MTNGDEKQKESDEGGVLDHEASIWEVLRKSEEKIRVREKKLTEDDLFKKTSE